MIAGTVAASVIVVAGVAWGHSSNPEWDLYFAAFRALFFVAWITRDMQFLQWISLRRSKHPLVMGALFLIIFYTCVMILMASLGIFTRPDRTALSAFFIPSGAFELDHSRWILRPAIWAAAFVAQWFLTALFIGLQKKTLDELSSPSTAPSATPVIAQT
jgi:predicted secreted protein